MAKFVNLTPHEIVIRRPDDTDLRVPPSGTVARVAVDETIIESAAGVPTVVRQFGRVEGLPEPRDDTFYIVSSLVISALENLFDDRLDVVAPDTGSSAIRDSDGRIIAVTRFVAPNI